MSERETKDFYDCIEWSAIQPWCNGKVGINGISHYAINQWLVAALQPPHLAAICVWEGAADWYRDWSRHGGILSQFDEVWFDGQVASQQHGVGERGARSRFNGELVAGPETLSPTSSAAAEIIATNLPIAGLFNNAGITQMKKATKNALGWDMTFATNYLGPFALTEALMPRLPDGANVLFVVSATEDRSGEPIDLARCRACPGYSL